MMYMHYCKRCHRVHMLNGHKMNCPACDAPLTELQIAYMDYIRMELKDRQTFDARLAEPDQLARLSTTYRMYKYSKWYKDLVKERQTGTVYPFEHVKTYGVAEAN